MAIKFTTPEAKFVASAAAVTEFRLIAPHSFDAQVGEPVLERDGIHVFALITQYAADGAQKQLTMYIPLADIPAAGKDMLKQMYAWLENEAIARGIAGEGAVDPLDQP